MNDINNENINITIDTLSKIIRALNTDENIRDNNLHKIKLLCRQISTHYRHIDRNKNNINNSANIIKMNDTKSKSNNKTNNVPINSTCNLHSNRCYICSNNIEIEHNFYEQLCNFCGDYNFQKRNVIIDLKDKIAIVTGGRIKIGFYTARQLLRCGAKVIVTTRFANDCLIRFQNEPDYSEYKDRLEIYQVDFLKFNQLHQFIFDITNKYNRIHILINNAAQTIKRPEQFYLHMKNIIATDTNNNIKNIYGEPFETIDYYEPNNQTINSNKKRKYITNANYAKNKIIKLEDNQVISNNHHESTDNNELINNDHESTDIYFPKGQYDEFGQQIDLRPKTNWIAKIDEINPLECAELFTINSIAPFYLIGQLKNKMKSTNDTKSWIINVSSMEGSFNRKFKTGYHPHNNMAKASLNMITRTCAKEYADDNIVMLSVDTGWNTIEEPISYHLRAPIDCIDGMARILDPIFNNLTQHGIFYKNFKSTSW